MFVFFCLCMTVPGVVDLSFAQPRFKELLSLTTGSKYSPSFWLSRNIKLQIAWTKHWGVQLQCFQNLFRMLTCCCQKPVTQGSIVTFAGRLRNWMQKGESLIHNIQTGPLNKASSPSNKRQKWLRDNCVNLLTPSQSPDLNLNKNLWKDLKINICWQSLSRLHARKTAVINICCH